MRNKFIKLIYTKIRKNDFFLTGDLGFSVLENIKKKLKKNFINIGISENNMFLVAIGLCNIKKKNFVYVYSISAFLILRTFEILRNFINNDNVNNIRLIGVGSGASYSIMGKTHYNFEDINMIYTLKNFIIINPANYYEAEYCFKKLRKVNRPIYFRINKNNDANINFIRKGNLFIKKGSRYNILSSGFVINYLFEILDKKITDRINFISIPILDLNYCKNIERYLVNGNSLLITDAFKPLFMYDLIENVKFKKKVKILNLEYPNKLKVNTEKEILNQMGLKKNKILDELR